MSSDNTTVVFPIKESGSGSVPQYHPLLQPERSCDYEAPADGIPGHAPVSVAVPTSADGMDMISLPSRPGYDSGLLTLVICAFLMVTFSLSHSSHIWKSFVQDIFSLRRRSNMFDQRTAGEYWCIGAMLVQTFIYEGLLMFAVLFNSGAWRLQEPFFPIIISMVAVAAVLYLFQLAGYYAVGFAFVDGSSLMQWIRGYNASQGILGFMLVVPALAAIFNPELTSSMSVTGIICYILMRLVFISKGFRIFYCGLGSLLYFILYLCALEFIPVMIAGMAAVRLCGSFN